MEDLLQQGYKKAKLRAHSDFMWNDAVNDWALEFLPYADIMCESKAKNLASIDLHKYWVGEYYENNFEKIVPSDTIRVTRSGKLAYYAFIYRLRNYKGNFENPFDK